MVSTEIDDRFLAHLIILGSEPVIRVSYTFNSKDYVVEGVRRLCFEKDSGIICIPLLKPGSTRECPIMEFAVRECVRDAFHRLILTGESFATTLSREWVNEPATVWSLWPGENSWPKKADLTAAPVQGM